MFLLLTVYAAHCFAASGTNVVRKEVAVNSHGELFAAGKDTPSLNGSALGLLREYEASEKKVYSQHGEDGIIEHICSIVGCHMRTYVEFGSVKDCTQCNSRYLRQKGWTGLVMGEGYEDTKINLHKDTVTVENVNHLFQKYGVHKHIDLLSVAVDGSDFYVLRSLLCGGKVSPKVIVVEYNSHIPVSAGAYVTPLTNPPNRCKGFCNGMSLPAVEALGNKFNYELVYTMTGGVSAFLVRKDVLPSGFEGPGAPALDRPKTYMVKGKGAQAWFGAQPYWDNLADKRYLLDSCRTPTYVQRWAGES